jgi:hypothetical protein
VALLSSGGRRAGSPRGGRLIAEYGLTRSHHIGQNRAWKPSFDNPGRP